MCIYYYTAALDHCQDQNPPKECEAVIPLSPDDPTYGKKNMTILKFMRLVTSPAYNCSLVPDTVVSIFYFIMKPEHYLECIYTYTNSNIIYFHLIIISCSKS